MNVIFVTDGSEDGLRAAQAVAKLFDPRVVQHVTLVTVTWPQRISPLWDRAHALRPAAHDDLHEAMAIVVDEVLKELRSYLASHAGSIDEMVVIGDPTERLLGVIKEGKPDLVFAAITNGEHRAAVSERIVEITKEARCPVVVAHGFIPQSV